MQLFLLLLYLVYAIYVWKIPARHSKAYWSCIPSWLSQSCGRAPVYPWYPVMIGLTGFQHWGPVKGNQVYKAQLFWLAEEQDSERTSDSLVRIQLVDRRSYCSPFTLLLLILWENRISVIPSILQLVLRSLELPLAAELFSRPKYPSLLY